MTIPLPHPIAQSSIFQLSVVSLVTLIISIFLNVLLLLFLDVFYISDILCWLPTPKDDDFTSIPFYKPHSPPHTHPQTDTQKPQTTHTHTPHLSTPYTTLPSPLHTQSSLPPSSMMIK